MKNTNDNAGTETSGLAAILIESQAAQIAELKTVMIAAAEEIASHWQAHCDAEGYGPQNLLRRLEEGIPSEYGYTAGAFAALTAERDALHLLCKRMHDEFVDVDFSAWPEMQGAQAEIMAEYAARTPAPTKENPNAQG